MPTCKWSPVRRRYALSRAKRPCGFTYVALLFMVATLGVGLAISGMDWHTTRQREKEAQLLFVGKEFQNAIALYYYRTPGGAYEYPKALEQLLEDKRFPTTQRYLRKIYRDPMTNRAEWGLVLSPGGGIAGVRSLSENTPLKTSRFPEKIPFADKRRYTEWEFVFLPASTK